VARNNAQASVAAPARPFPEQRAVHAAPEQHSRQPVVGQLASDSATLDGTPEQDDAARTLIRVLLEKMQDCHTAEAMSH
jgi:hypothetical protein